MIKIGAKVKVINSKNSNFDRIGLVDGRVENLYRVKFIDQSTETYKESELQVLRSFSGKKFDAEKGEVIRVCPAGWSLVKTTVTIKEVDKTIYKLVKSEGTPANKEKWDEIKGELLTSFGFRWNSFNQTFDRWSTIDGVDLDALCGTLEKYYGLNQAAPVPSTPNSTASTDAKPHYLFFRYNNNKEDDTAWVVMSRLYVKSDDGYQYFVYDDTTKDFTIKWGNNPLPVRFAHEQDRLIHEKGWFFNIDKQLALDLITGKSNPAKAIEICTKTYDGKKDPDGYNSFVSIRPFNPDKKEDIKVLYCRILSAEGSDEYWNLFPKTFKTFTELTTFIREHITMPDQGYDKHFVEWIWEDGSWGQSRWDVSPKEADPFKYTNLWAYENLGYRFFDAINGHNVGTWDDFYQSRGVEGMELTKMQLEFILDSLTASPYWAEKSKLTQEQQKKKIRETFPKLFSLFNEQLPQLTDAEFIKKKIKGLELVVSETIDPSEIAQLQKLIKGLRLISE